MSEQDICRACGHRIAAVLRRKAAQLGETLAQSRWARETPKIVSPKAETERLRGAKAALEVMADEIDRWEPTEETHHMHASTMNYLLPTD
jgi:hypothetical protein